MRRGIVLKSCLVVTAMLLCLGSVSAQQVRFFPDFASVANLQMNGSHQATWDSQEVLRLTDGYTTNGDIHPAAATTWFTIPQQVNMGFTTYFQFQIHNAGLCCTPGDGLAFVVQNATHTDPTYGATGAGITSRGVGNGGLGYAGIPNSLAVEFDTFTNAWDPSSNHVAVQGCGTQTNGPVHIPGTFTIGNNHNVTSCLVANGINSNIPHLGVTCGNTSCADGAIHWVVIEYTPPANLTGNGTLAVWIDQPLIPHTHTPCPNTRVQGCPVAAVTSINIPYNIDNAHSSTGISLAGGTSAWVGFTASQTTMPQAQDILSWEFTPHAPAQVQQVIPPGGTEAHYTFGSNDTVVNYFPGFVNDPNDPYLMTVVATPTTRSSFYVNRLLGTQFSNEQCIVYLGTGGNCVIYSITCQRQSNPHVDVTCPSSANACDNTTQLGCIQFSTSFYTSDGVTTTDADYLKADPIGSNNWVSIFVSYNPNTFDGQTSGKGHDPSDFAATFRVGTH
jgi:Bacterial lectin